jgi:rfaE bifunctional protein nucleotidyltransferase chain/domain
VEYCRRKWIEPEALPAAVAAIRAQGSTLATLNGSFDLLHAGHLEMLYQASLQADVLLLALNTDASIQRYKSPLRPIIPLEQRLQMVTALEMVDYVTWFDETDPRRMLEAVRPDVHVNGEEYGEQCIEAETVRAHGGRVHIVRLVPGWSTSMIIERVKRSCV